VCRVNSEFSQSNFKMHFNFDISTW
jgi:hypothetical protein